MRVTRLGPSRPILSLTGILSESEGGPSGQVPTANGSNSVAWGSNVANIWSNGSNKLLGPEVNFASGSNIIFSVASNTLTISALATGGGAVTFGSNSTRVSEDPLAGVSADSSRADHRHDGIGTITASSSNTMQRGTWNIRPGSGIALSLSDSDGDGEFDTTTIINTGSGGGGGGGGGSGAVTAVYRVFTSTSDTHNPDVTTDTQVDSMTLTFSLSAASDCLITFDCRSNKSGADRTRYRIYDGSTQIAPDNESTFNGWYSVAVGESGGQMTHFKAMQNLASGSHTINIKWQAAIGTSQVIFYDRLLVVEVLA
jgi:hypothetical protein